MRRLTVALVIAVTALPLVGPLGAHAQQTRPTVASGDTVRVHYGSGAVHEGVVLEVQWPELRIADGADARTIHLDRIGGIDVRRGTRPWGPIKGAAIGVGTALLAGLIWETSDSFEKQGCEIVDRSGNGKPIWGNCDRDGRNLDQWWLISGAAVGFAAGHLIRVPRWVEAEGVGLAIGRSKDGAVTLGLRVATGS
ncbi:MAG: hypothetical protein ABFS34_16990 [Gemmatimonadota bacterium]